MQLNTAQKGAKRVRPATSRIIRPLFNTESPNFTRIFMQTYSSATPNITSSATQGRHLSKFEKRPKMPPPMALDRILVARRFA